MIKYYVSSGDSELIVMADDAEQAATKFIDSLWGEDAPPEKQEQSLGLLVRASEVGFSDDGPGHDQDLYMLTDNLLTKMYGDAE